jgi:hypothetical protein
MKAIDIWYDEIIKIMNDKSKTPRERAIAIDNLYSGRD